MVSEQKTGLERVNYFDGQLLTTTDFTAEQNYFLEKDRLRNRYLFGCGIAGGLDVRVCDRMLRIEAGLAIDCCGRELFVPCAQEVELPDEDQAAFVCLQYREQQANPVSTPIPAPDGSAMNFARTIEFCEVLYELQNPMKGHRCFRKGWIPCGADHSVPLARLVIRRRGHAVRRVRRIRLRA